jgi:predicted sulfurtransferase
MALTNQHKRRPVAVTTTTTTTTTKNYKRFVVMMMLLQLFGRYSRQYPQKFIVGTTAFSPSRQLSKFVTSRSTSVRLMDSIRSHQENTTSTAPTSSTATSSSTNNHLPTNQELVQRRLTVQRAKLQARERTIQERVSKNLHIKRLLHTSSNNNDNNQQQSSSEFVVPPLYAVKVWVDDKLREELKLSGREKRGRVFIERGAEGTFTLRGLKQEMFAFFSALKKDSFILTATLPRLADDGTVLSPETRQEALIDSWKIEDDDDVVKTFAMADEFFYNATSATSEGPTVMKRPSIQINVMKNPNAPPPPPPPPYLEGMADPSTSETMTMLSFYAFPPSGIEDPEAFAFDMKKKWKPFHALGRVYVAQEGVNAQMSVPTNVLPNFMECCRSMPELGQYMENDINIDPKPLTQGEFAVAGVPVNGKQAPPFRNLHVRVRKQVVADGLDKSLDWQSAGYDMPPLEWHEKLKEAREKMKESSNSKNDIPILLDCRNTYETDVGIFEGAEPLGTESFRESWDVLKERLADTPKDAPIMTYCTGGIRCVKVGAYLTQELGFTNVSRLAGGIIAYDRTLNEKAEEEESMFKGTNFVFDGRLGRQITEDALANCVTCGAETSLVSNCRNDNCHQRIVQCEACRTSYHGTCSVACKNRLVNGAMAPHRILSESKSSRPPDDEPNVGYKNLDDYSMGHSSPVPNVYKEIELNTQSYLASGSHMVRKRKLTRKMVYFLQRISQLHLFVLSGIWSVAGTIFNSAGFHDSKRTDPRTRHVYRVRHSLSLGGS